MLIKIESHTSKAPEKGKSSSKQFDSQGSGLYSDPSFDLELYFPNEMALLEPSSRQGEFTDIFNWVDRGQGLERVRLSQLYSSQTEFRQNVIASIQMDSEHLMQSNSQFPNLFRGFNTCINFLWKSKLKNAIILPKVSSCILQNPGHLETGKLEMCLFSNGKWVTVSTDDKVLVTKSEQSSKLAGPQNKSTFRKITDQDRTLEIPERRILFPDSHSTGDVTNPIPPGNLVTESTAELQAEGIRTVCTVGGNSTCLWGICLQKVYAKMVGNYLGVIGRQNPEIILRDLTGCPVSRHTISKDEIDFGIHQLDDLYTKQNLPILFESRDLNSCSKAHSSEFISSSELIAANSGYILTGLAHSNTPGVSQNAQKSIFYRLEKLTYSSEATVFPQSITVPVGMLATYFSGYSVVHYTQGYATSICPFENVNSGNIESRVSTMLGHTSIRIPAGSKGVIIGVSFQNDRRSEPSNYLFGKEDYPNTFLIVRQTTTISDQHHGSTEERKSIHSVCSTSRETWIKVFPSEPSDKAEVFSITVVLQLDRRLLR